MVSKTYSRKAEQLAKPGNDTVNGLCSFSWANKMEYAHFDILVGLEHDNARGCSSIFPKKI